MTDNRKIYSVLIAWCDGDDEQGDYGTFVRARDAEEAERLAREDMRTAHIQNHGFDSLESYTDDEDGTFGGSVLDLCEGATWKADDMEKALRALEAEVQRLKAVIPAVAEAIDNRPVDAARALLAELDAIGPTLEGQTREAHCKIAAEAKGWKEQCGVIFNTAVYDDWKAAAADNDGNGTQEGEVYGSWQECCEGEDIEVAA